MTLTIALCTSNLTNLLCDNEESRRWHRGLKRLSRKRKVRCSNPNHDRQVLKTGSDSSTAYRLTIIVSVTSPRIQPFQEEVPQHSRCDTLQIIHCSMTMIADRRSTSRAFYCNFGIKKCMENVQTNIKKRQSRTTTQKQSKFIMWKTVLSLIIESFA